MNVHYFCILALNWVHFNVSTSEDILLIGAKCGLWTKTRCESETKVKHHTLLVRYRQISFLSSYSGLQYKYFLCKLNIVSLITILSLFVESFAIWNKSKSHVLKKPCFDCQNRGFRKNPPERVKIIFLLCTLAEETWSVWFDY